jgi:ketosteroid isomerase-like protein
LRSGGTPIDRKCLAGVKLLLCESNSVYSEPKLFSSHEGHPNLHQSTIRNVWRVAAPSKYYHKQDHLMSTEDEIRKASTQFYAALTRMLNGDAQPVFDIWSHGPAVTAMHPIGGRQVGWNEVRESWEQVAQGASDGKVELKDQLIRVLGDVAYEVGVECPEFKLGGEKVTGQLRVTNIYEREAGAWKMTHHHTDLAPAMLEVLSRLQSRSKEA